MTKCTASDRGRYLSLHVETYVVRPVIRPTPLYSIAVQRTTQRSAIVRLRTAAEQLESLAVRANVIMLHCRTSLPRRRFACRRTAVANSIPPFVRTVQCRHHLSIAGYATQGCHSLPS